MHLCSDIRCIAGSCPDEFGCLTLGQATKSERLKIAGKRAAIYGALRIVIGRVQCAEYCNSDTRKRWSKDKSHDCQWCAKCASGSALQLAARKEAQHDSACPGGSACLQHDLVQLRRRRKWLTLTFSGLSGAVRIRRFTRLETVTFAATPGEAGTKTARDALTHVTPPLLFTCICSTRMLLACSSR